MAFFLLRACYNLSYLSVVKKSAESFDWDFLSLKFLKLFIFFLIFLNQWTGLLSKINFGNQNSTIEFSGSNSYFKVNNPILDFNGTLKAQDDAVGRITGSNLVFNNGVLKFDGQSDINFTGTYNSALNNQMTLQDGTALNFASGKTVNSKIMVPAGATIKLSGAPLLTQSIVLADATSTLRIALKTNLGQDIYLNGGTLILEDDLLMSAGTKIWGGGTIDVNNKKFSSPGGNFADGDITYLNTQDVTLTGNTTYTTNQAFSGTNNDFFGGGNTVTLASANGRITVNAAATFNGLNTYFTGLAGTSNATNFGVFNINATGTVFLKNSTLNLAGNYTQATGTIVFGDNCKIITHGFAFNVTGATQIIVDGTTLQYDNLDSNDNSPFTFTDQASQLKLQNRGNIRSTVARGPYNLTTAAGTLYNDYILSAAAPIRITQPATTLAGGGFALHFPTTDTSLITLSNSATVTTSNIVLNNFNKDAITYGTSALMNFGSGTQIRLFDDVTLSGADKAWNFIGNGLIVGTQNTLTLNGANRLTVTGSSTLTLKNLRILCLSLNAFACLDAGSKIVFENCTLALTEIGFAFSTGNIDVLGTLNVVGGSTTLASSETKFSFASQGLFRVLSNSKLLIDRGVEFEYKANPAGDSNVIAVTKRHFLLLDPTSTLEINGGTLHSTTTGFALNYGRLVIDDTVKLVIDGAGLQACELGSAVELVVRPSATLEVGGILAYINTSFP